jgi:hypothetical protein
MRLSIVLSILALTLSPLGCKTKKAKKPSPVPTVSPTQPPVPPIPPPNPNKPDVPPPNPNKPDVPPPNPNDPTPSPTPTPIPSNGQLPSVQIDANGDPIIPQTPIVSTAHIVMTDGSARIYTGWVSSLICFNSRVVAYYKPCDTGLYCWTPATQCGYILCR